MRHRLLTIILLSVVTSALSLVALARILSLSTSLRIERAREAVAEEAAHLASMPDIEQAIRTPPVTAMMGMRAGVLDGRPLPSDVPQELKELVFQARSGATTGSVVVDRTVNENSLAVCVQPLANGRAVWAGILLRPPVYLHFWQGIGLALAIATALLAGSALLAITRFKQGTSELQTSLSSLARDLSSPVPRPAIRELGDIADGIATLAKELALSRLQQEKLSAELFQQERLAALGRVVAGVAHEVRNPLASIKLQLDLAVATNSLPPNVKGSVQQAAEEIMRLDRLVADLLVVAGRRTGPLRRMSVGALVQRRVDALSPWITLRGVSVLAEGDGEALIDPDSLGRAIDNLLRNAVEASPQSGTVHVQVLNRGDELRVCVEDQGVGVSPSHAAELFEPFFTTKPEGTGLGLAISRSIARAHGGEVRYQRREGKTMFELSLARGAVPGMKGQEQLA